MDFKYKSYKDHKIYAVISDMHSSQDLCYKNEWSINSGCAEKTFFLQQDRGKGSFLNLLEKELEGKFGYQLPKIHKKEGADGIIRNDRLHFITRVSSHVIARENKENIDSKYAVQLNKDDRNIKTLDNSVILHTNDGAISKTLDISNSVQSKYYF